MLNAPYLLGCTFDPDRGLKFVQIIGLQIYQNLGSCKDLLLIACRNDFKADFQSNREEDGIHNGSSEDDPFVFLKKVVLLFFPAHEKPRS